MKPRKANKGSFRRGPDKRRHTFTYEERSKGFFSALQRVGNYHWLICRVRGSDPCQRTRK